MSSTEKNRSLYKALLVHKAIEFTPAVLYLALLVSGYITKVNIGVVLLLIVLSRYGIFFLDILGMARPLFGMELISDNERGLVIGQELLPMVTTVIKIGRPDDLKLLQLKIKSHFMSYSRFRSKWVSVSYSYFFKEVTDQKLLDATVHVHPQ